MTARPDYLFPTGTAGQFPATNRAPRATRESVCCELSENVKLAISVIDSSAERRNAPAGSLGQGCVGHRVCRPGCVGRDRHGRDRPASEANLCGEQHRENRRIRMADRVYSHPADHAGDRAVSLGLHPGGSMLQSQVGKTG